MGQPKAQAETRQTRHAFQSTSLLTPTSLQHTRPHKVMTTAVNGLHVVDHHSESVASPAAGSSPADDTPPRPPSIVSPPERLTETLQHDDHNHRDKTAGKQYGRSGGSDDEEKAASAAAVASPAAPSPALGLGGEYPDGGLRAWS